jgi:hypothetical protein
VVASVFHVYLNWKPLVSYFKSKVSKAFALRIEWAFALVICGVVFLGTLGDITPFSSLLVWNENIKNSWDSTEQRAPIPHAELLTLTELSEQVSDVSLETILTNLKSQGIEVKSSEVVLGDLAEAHNMTPVHLYDIALGHDGPRRGQGHGGSGQGGERRGGGGRGFGGPGGRTEQHGDTQVDTGAEHEQGGNIQGFGRMTLNSYCNQMGMDVNEAVKKLNDAGFKASPDMTMRSIADTTGVQPSEIRPLLEPPIQ